MTAMDPAEAGRLRWRSRRGLLELDLVFERFLADRFDALDARQLEAYRRLLAWPDNDLLDAVNGLTVPDDPELAELIGMLRA